MCRLPLYQQAQHADLGSVAIQSGNAGLYFTRFYNQYTDGQLQGEYGAKNEEGKSKFLIKFANVVGQLEQLEQYTFRQITLMDAIGGSARLYGLNGHFVTGMGYEHPVENGFQWHYTLGVPYLAGSQVKGMVRSMIERYLDDSADNKAALLLKWFGSTDKDPQKKGDQSQAGELIFFDALPYKKPILTIDVMTPHMGDWYAKGGNIQNPQDSDKIPADWHDPVPIPFLTVKDAQFVFSIGKREGSNIDLGDVWDVLDQALTYLGAGGKTNTGFGYMTYEEQQTKKLYKEIKDKQIEQQKQAQQAAQLAAASPFHAELLRTANEQDWEKVDGPGKTPFTAAMDPKQDGWLLKKLQEHPNEQDSIAYVINIAQKHYPQQMKNPTGKKTKPNQRAWIEALLALHKPK